MKNEKSKKEDYKHNLTLKDFILNKKDEKKLLGIGAFAKVYLAYCKIDKKNYAIKEVK